MKRDRYKITSAGEIQRLELDLAATEHLHVRYSPARKRFYKAAARRARQKLSEWVLEQLDRAAAK